MIDASLARRLKLVGLDVDGVLTDNGVYLGMVGDHPVEFKRFHIQDGLGVRMLRAAGLAVVWVSGRESAATALRARELAVDELIQEPTARKLPLFEALLARRGLAWHESACRSPWRTASPRCRPPRDWSPRCLAARARCAKWRS